MYSFMGKRKNAEVRVPMAMSLGSDSFPSSQSAAMALDFSQSQTAGGASLDGTVACTNIHVDSAFFFALLLSLTFAPSNFMLTDYKNAAFRPALVFSLDSLALHFPALDFFTSLHSCRLVWYHAENKVSEWQGQHGGRSPDSLVDGSVLRSPTVTVIWAPEVASAVSVRPHCHTLVFSLWSLKAMSL